jgi:hypothetical protein
LAIGDRIADWRLPDRIADWAIGRLPIAPWRLAITFSMAIAELAWSLLIEGILASRCR